MVADRVGAGSICKAAGADVLRGLSATSGGMQALIEQ